MPGKRQILAYALDRTRATDLIRSANRRVRLITLNYHRIGDSTGSVHDHELWSATVDRFSEQVRWLQLNFDVIGIDDLDEALTTRNGRFAMITFDDGYRDNYESAFPVLQALGAPATFFVTSGFLDDRRIAWWDEIAWMLRSRRREAIELTFGDQPRLSLADDDIDASIRTCLRLYKQLSGERCDSFVAQLADLTGSGRCPAEQAAGIWMTWDDVRTMHAAGMNIGGHTVNHPVLANLSAERQQREITDSKQRIETELGRPIRAFSYPVGQRDSFNQQTRDALRESGYRFAFSFYGGYCDPGDVDRFNLPRIPVEMHMRPADFRAAASIPQLFGR